VRPGTPARCSAAALGLALVAAIAGACGGQTQGSPGASVPVATAAIPAESGVAPTLTPTAAASTGPSTPAATPLPTEAYRFGDILRIQVDRLAARKSPDRSAALVHRYDTSGETPIDKGEVRLSKGTKVMVGVGPLRVGNIVWYLVWPSPDGKVSDSTSDWYAGKPADVSSGPAWVAASLDANIYMVLDRRPDVSEIEAKQAVGLFASGTGAYESAPQPRHDAFLLDWAAAAPDQGSPCTFRVSMTPADAGVPPKKPVDTSTSTAKSSPLLGLVVNAPWLPIPAGSWTTFTVKITGSCAWTFRLTRLEHD
jgi:hypothetical protein